MESQAQIEESPSSEPPGSNKHATRDETETETAIQYRLTARLMLPTALIIALLAYLNVGYEDLTLMIGLAIALGNIGLSVFGTRFGQVGVLRAARVAHNLLWSLLLVAVCGPRAPGWLIGCVSLLAFGAMAQTRTTSTTAWAFIAAITGVTLFNSEPNQAVTAAVTLASLWVIARSVFATTETFNTDQIAEKRRQIEVMSALHQSAATITAGLSATEIYRKAGDTLRRCGFNLTIMGVDGDRMKLDHLSFPEELVQKAERLVNIKRSAFSAPISRHDFFVRIAEKRTAVFSRDGADITAKLAGVNKTLARAVMQTLGWTHVYGAPLNRGDQLAAFLVISGNRLGPRDRALIEVFAAQLEAAVRQANLIADLRDRQLRLKQALAATKRKESERIRARDAAARASHLASLGTLAAGIAHEINNPLTFILGNIQFIEELSPNASDWSKSVNEDFREAVDDVKLGATRIKEIVQGVKLFSRVSESPEVKLVDLAEVVKSSLALAGAELNRRARVETELTENTCIQANSSRLGQVCVNLLVNAAQSITPGNINANLVRIRVYPSDDMERAVLEVSDTGCGISEEDQKHIFEPFYSTKKTGDGTGLGLSIIAGIVTDMGGRIELESKLNEGTTFRIFLNLAEPVTKTEPHGDEDFSSPPSGRRRMRVLLLTPKYELRTKLNTVWSTARIDHASSVATGARLQTSVSYDVLMWDATAMPNRSISSFRQVQSKEAKSKPAIFALVVENDTNPDKYEQLAEAYADLGNEVKVIAHDALFSNHPDWFITLLKRSDGMNRSAAVHAKLRPHRLLTPGGSSAPIPGRNRRLPTPTG